MGSTVGTVVISYDINRLHTEVKERMISVGYFDNWHYNNEKSNEMPNTTLWHKQKSSDTAINDLRSICHQLNVNLEKAVAVLASEFAGV